MPNALGPAEKSIASVVEAFRQKGQVVHPNEVARLVGCPHHAAREALSRLFSLGLIRRRTFATKAIKVPEVEAEDWSKTPRTQTGRKRINEFRKRQERIDGFA